MRRFFLLVSCLASVGAGCTSDAPSPVVTTPARDVQAPVRPLGEDDVRIDPQSPSETVIIRESQFSKRGFIVIHLDEAGKPGKILGVSDVQSVGHHGETWISVSPSLQQGKTYFATLRHDNGDNRYDPTKDEPVKQGDTLVQIPFDVVAVRNENEVASPATEITIKNFAFSPDTVTVKRGTPIRFVNADTMNHTATSDKPGFDSGMLGSGQSFTLDTGTLVPGSYPYHCSPHPDMRGTLIIE